MATLQDVADRAGVTITTVSRMLNGRVPVSDQTRAKIEQAMRELGYRPNEMARSLAKKTTNLIGLIVPSAKHFFFAELIQEVERAVAKSGCQLLLCVSNQEFEKEKNYYQMLLGDRVRGIIVASYSQGFEKIAHEGTPMVYIERKSTEGIPSAMMDSIQGGLLAGRHLIGQGCRHLLYLSGNASRNSVSNQRYEGFCQACVESGLEAPAILEATWEEFISLNYDAAVERLFQEHPEVDGILTSNDIMAATVVRYCLSRGLEIPDRVKVVGYDDTTFAALCPVPLTTIHQPVSEIAQFSVNCIMRQSRGETVPSMTMFPVRLIERGTT